MNLKRPLFGPDDPRGPTVGADVAIVKWGLNRVEENFFPRPVGGFDNAYNRKTVDAVKVLQRLNDLEATGHVGQKTLDVIWAYLDAYRRWKYRAFIVPKPVPPPPVLVQPTQGWASLHPSLHELFSIGRNMGMSDLGTFNATSRLPSGGPSDHAVWPAMAFDLGVDPDTGFDNAVGRAFFWIAVSNPAVEYVILGDKIYSRARGFHGYTGGGHSNHLHCSGLR